MSQLHAEVQEINFSKFGNGKNVLILFHGFGQDSSVFQSYLEPFSRFYTVYSIDLFFHGKSDWIKQRLTDRKWKEIFQRFLTSETIEKFSLLGFSLGGRFAISTVVLFPEKIDKILLIAPDGIHRSFWYRFATHRLFNLLFKHLMVHPDRFDSLLNIFERYKMVSKPLVKFSRKELGAGENRMRVYFSWTYFKGLQVSPEKLLRHLALQQLTVHLILGTKDSIIQPAKLEPLIQHSSFVKIHHLPSKHHHLIDEALPIIMSVIEQEKP